MGNRNSANSLPDFIIGGAAKSGTSTLHWLLDSHPDVFIPRREIHFFDIDDVEQHPDFVISGTDGWYTPDYASNFDRYMDWYKTFFEDAKPGQLIGEDSTTYLASSKAPERIRNVLPDVKLIFLLRDPVERTYSQYWQRVANGLMTQSFQKALRDDLYSLVQRSLYKNQVEQFLDVFPREQIKFILFENFIEDVEGTMDELSDFLEIDNHFDLSDEKTVYNKTLYPESVKLQLWCNQKLRWFSGSSYSSHLPDAPDVKPSVLRKIFRKVIFKLNMNSETKPPLRKRTRKFLERFFRKENRGLGDLLSLDFQGKWHWF